MADVSQIKLPNGSVYDLIDEKSGYITAEYIENKTDYSIPVSRVGEIVVGETAIGTNSTNFPTSKAVVDYVDERVVQEIEAISVPTKTSDLTNDSGYLKSTDIDLDNYVPIEKTIGDTTYTYEIKYDEFSTFRQVRIEVSKGSDNFAAITLSGDGAAVLAGSEATEIYNVITPTSNDMAANKKYVDDSISAISIPTKTSDLTNDSNFTAKSTTTATLTTTWSSKTQTVSVTGVTASNTVIITPAPASYNAYCEYGVYCSAQSSGTLTFTCDEVPTSSLTVNVLILN